jgi:F0F1-type ATP synthase epsilon subunit
METASHHDRSFPVTILDAEKTFFEGRAVSVIVPCALGYLGILRGHADLAARTAEGAISLRLESGEVQDVPSREGGMLSVTSGTLQIIF